MTTPTPSDPAETTRLSEEQIRHIVSLCGPPEAFAADLPLLTQGPVFVRRLLEILDAVRVEKDFEIDHLQDVREFAKGVMEEQAAEIAKLRAEAETRARHPQAETKP